jgi:carboxypeptidase Q
MNALKLRVVRLAAVMLLLGNSHWLIAGDTVDVATVDRITIEAEEHSQVMETASWLCDVYGPRLTASPATKEATDWAVTKLRSWGLADVHLEKWNPYDGGLTSEQWQARDRGWTSEQFAFRAVTPRPFIITAVPCVYSPSTNGRVTGPAIRFDAHSFLDMQRFEGKLKDAFLLVDPATPTPAHFKAQATRLTDTQLDAIAKGEPGPQARREVMELRYDALADSRARQWLIKQGVAAALFTSAGDGGTIVMSGKSGSERRKTEAADEIPCVKVSAESYGRIVRILEKDIPVTLELDMQNTFYDNPDVFNIIAEITGVDPKIKDEVVMMGAHFDSWTFGTGATDDGAGAAVVMEAMRILKALDLQPARTIRIGLWTGEEQGGLGSKAYVQKHFWNWVQLENAAPSPTKPEHEKFSVYFNLDGGTGKIRGIDVAGNIAARPIFEKWMGPFNGSGMKTTSPSDTGSADQLAFVRVGLPSFSFIQDPIEYGSRTHHTSADVYERLQPEDLRFNAAVLASFAWQAAQRDEKLPRVGSRH